MATIYKENTAGDANANTAKLIRDRANANATSTLSNGNTRTYNTNGSSYTDANSSGNNVGGGIAGTENYSVGNSGSYGPSGGSATQSNVNNQSMSQSSYEQKLIDYQTQVAQAAAASKQAALKSAWEGNSQALNSQNATVDNNFNSAKNNLTALQASRTPEYQAQKDATSQEAAAQLRRTQALNANDRQLQ